MGPPPQACRVDDIDAEFPASIQQLQPTIWIHPIHSMGAGPELTPVQIDHTQDFKYDDAFSTQVLNTKLTTSSKKLKALISGGKLVIAPAQGKGPLNLTLRFAKITAKMVQIQKLIGSAEQRPIIAILPDRKASQTVRMEMRSHFSDAWFVLVNGNTDDLQIAMHALASEGAIRTDLNRACSVSSCVIGKGGVAKVMLAEPRMFVGTTQQQVPGTPKLVAKVFHGYGMIPASNAKTEAAVFLDLGRHPNIVRFHGIFADKTHLGESWTMLLENAAYRDLEKVLKDNGKLTLPSTKHVVHSILRALQHMHSKGCIHRDVKPLNVLLARHSRILLADMGLAAGIQDSEALHLRCGTPGYVAPEILSGGRTTEAVDIFSVGAILHIARTGESLFRGETREAILQANYACDVHLAVHGDPTLGQLGRDLLSSMLNRDKDGRPTASVALRHDWLSNGICEQIMAADGTLLAGSSDTSSLEQDAWLDFQKSNEQAAEQCSGIERDSKGNEKHDLWSSLEETYKQPPSKTPSWRSFSWVKSLPGPLFRRAGCPTKVHHASEANFSSTLPVDRWAHTREGAVTSSSSCNSRNLASSFSKHELNWKAKSWTRGFAAWTQIRHG